MTGDILHGDARERLSGLPDEHVYLTVTSPPYRIGKSYEDGKDSIEEWRTMMRGVIHELWRVTAPDGKFVINLGKSYEQREDERFQFYSLSRHVLDICREVGWDYWAEFIWNKKGFNNRGGGALMGSYPYPRNLMATETHERILVFRKYVSDDYVDRRYIPETGTVRREESALTKERWQELTQSVWEFPGVRQDSFDLDLTAAFPEELPKRAVQLYSFKGDTVLDPFCGRGTTCVAAKQAGRHYVGIDAVEDYAEYARDWASDVKFNDPDYTEER